MPQTRPSQPSRSGNRLLDLLPEADLARVLEKAERVTAILREVVADAGEPAGFADFPVTGVLSAIVPLRDGSSIEATTIGNEGMAGIDLLEPRGRRIDRRW